MYGRREEIEFVKSNIEQDNLIYADKVRYEKWADEKIKECRYEIAVALMEKGEYGEAIIAFQKVYSSEATEKRNECYKIIKYNNANDMMNSGAYEEAMNEFELLEGYKDSNEKILECMYNSALVYIDKKAYTPRSVCCYPGQISYPDRIPCP